MNSSSAVARMETRPPWWCRGLREVTRVHPALPSERRAAPRLVASLPIMFEWSTRESEFCRARGRTHDISLGGVHCYLERPLASGLPVQFHVVFPAQLTVGESLNFRCTGRILRSESRRRRFGVIASIDSSQAIENGRSSTESNHRAHTRIMPFASIAVQYPQLRPVIRDLSPTGAFIEDQRPLPVGRQFDLRLGGQGILPEVRLKAIVRRTEPYMGMAVEFVAISKEDDRHLQEFLERCSRKRP